MLINHNWKFTRLLITGRRQRGKTTMIKASANDFKMDVCIFLINNNKFKAK